MNISLKVRWIDKCCYRMINKPLFHFEMQPHNPLCPLLRIVPASTMNLQFMAIFITISFLSCSSVNARILSPITETWVAVQSQTTKHCTFYILGTACGNSFILMVSSSGQEKESIAQFFGIYRWKSGGGQNFEVIFWIVCTSFPVLRLKIDFSTQNFQFWSTLQVNYLWNSSWKLFFKNGIILSLQKGVDCTFFPNCLEGGQNFEVKKC